MNAMMAQSFVQCEAIVKTSVSSYMFVGARWCWTNEMFHVEGYVRWCKRTNILHREAKEDLMVNMGVEPRTLALLAPRSKPTELIDRYLRAFTLRL